MINLNKKSLSAQITAVIALLVLLSACHTKRVIYTPKGYDITKPEEIELGSKLREISGIAWVNDKTMLAENDEAGKVFTINLKDKTDIKYPNFSFGEKNDYEDIVKIDTTIYLLISTGEVVEVPGYAKGADVQGTIIGSMAGKNNEFESMYFDKEVHSLVLLCKSCHKEKDQIRTAYRFDLNTRMFIDTPYYTIDLNVIRQKLNDSRAEFRPSAAAVHPLQNKLYIVSSIGKLLVITNKKGKVEQVIPISASMFPQPEGITFAANGDMYISNEAGTEESATLLKFIYKP